MEKYMPGSKAECWSYFGLNWINVCIVMLIVHASKVRNYLYHRMFRDYYTNQVRCGASSYSCPEYMCPVGGPGLCTNTKKTTCHNFFGNKTLEYLIPHSIFIWKQF